MYNKKYILNKLKKIAPACKLLVDEPLANHTTFKIGGKADFVIMPRKLEEIVQILMFLQKTKIAYYILGNGSNILVGDKGFRGVVIKMTGLDQIIRYDNKLQVFAGASLNDVIGYAVKNNLQGMEQGSGIPGTVGGAIIMNAGAFEYETQNVVLGVLAFVDGKLKYFTNKECEFGYRSSVFKQFVNPVIIRVDFMLNNNTENLDILDTREKILARRAFYQPLDKPSAGSVFKRLDGLIVSKMIDEAGLKGHKVGGAKVSTKHAGFIVNAGNAKAKDVIGVISYVKQEFKKTYDLDLEEEIKYVGEFE